ncbi:MAG: RNA-binding transcriptional accessory protein [Firmicutes bacterium]|nr:RNA-binding transcriptional accessory protein [Bacillota bacterium]
MDKIIKTLAAETGRREDHIRNVITLLDEGSTIPFIARYRKEMHGSMDDTALRELADRLGYLRNLESRKLEVKKSIENQEKLTEELAKEIDDAKTLTEVEDLYRPYKQKRRTRATVAKEKGLEPLAALIFSQSASLPALSNLAEKYIDEEKGVLNSEDALAGASDIIAEFISDSADIRKVIREYFLSHGRIVSQAAKEEESVYMHYYDFQQTLSKLQGHQVLALNRGEKEGFLKIAVEADKDKVLDLIYKRTVTSSSEASDFVKTAAQDAWDRLISSSIKNELRSSLTEEASEGAIHNFALNLKPLLMQPPVKGHITMGLDPGYKNGCKVAVIDGTGKVLDTCVVYPTFSEKKKNEAIQTLSAMIKKNKVEHIAIGNGTASRETEQMTVEMIRGLGSSVSYMIVNEAGASVYSASKLAAEEFPQFDVNLRSAVSIARRLQDPLAELVKIDPKAIGVGQYQHDMPQKRLDESLSGVVEDCVNAVGVDLNTASPALLQRVSGLNSSTAGNIVAYREANGEFTSRKQLLKVPKLGPKAFEQSAGFLRIPGSKNLLDNTGVHPESYKAAEALLELCGYDIKSISSDVLNILPEKIKKFGEKQLAEKCGIGVPTLQDIVKELMKPGRDPRDELPAPILRTDILEMKDLKEGMILSGTVRNVIDFGVFVDIGVHQDGLVHISEITEKYIKHPSEVLSVGDIVKVSVLSVDEKRKRISLSIKQAK